MKSVVKREPLKSIKGVYTKKNKFIYICFSNIEPKICFSSNVRWAKTNKEYIYITETDNTKYRGTPYQYFRWTTVEVTGQIIEKIEPILYKI